MSKLPSDVQCIYTFVAAASHSKQTQDCVDLAGNVMPGDLE